MQFKNLNAQYLYLKENINKAISKVLTDGNYIAGIQVKELEKELADYVGTEHCITCANGTDALELALRAWGIGVGDAVFVPDFTFFASGEAVSMVGATPIFVDVDENTFNISPASLEIMIQRTLEIGKLIPRVILAVDLFGQPADYEELKKIASNYHLLILEDGAQGFGGKIGERSSLSFGDISTTSFFPAKPLGCYGDGGAVFTDDGDWAALIRSLAVHGKGKDKYDNIYIGMNSRLDTIQAAVLQEKLKAFQSFELEKINVAADCYSQLLCGSVKTPMVRNGYYSSWAQYAILLKNRQERDLVQEALSKKNIPSYIYYPVPMHRQGAFKKQTYSESEYQVTNMLCECILELPIDPYLTEENIRFISKTILESLK